MGLHLDERDARSLARHIVHHLQSLGARVTNFGVHLEREGFTFMAEVNGRAPVWVQTGQGNFTYEAVAAELLNAALHHGHEFTNPELEIVKEPTTH
jgi:hypothetical protein